MIEEFIIENFKSYNELAKRRKFSVLITSHNPTLLNASPADNISDL
ncbi:MAG: hypothetical protein WBG43_09885 [Marinifilaceae bacterium]